MTATRSQVEQLTDLGPLEDWLAECRASGLQPSSLAKRAAVLRGVQRATGAPLTDVTERQVRRWWLSIAGLAVRTRAVRLSHLACACRWLVREDIRPDDPTRRIQRPRLPRSVPRDVDADRARAAIGAIGDDAVRLAATLQLDDGLRVSEVAGIKPARDLITRQGVDWLRVRGKGGHEREVPVTADLARQLRDVAGLGWLLPSSASSTGHMTPDHLGGLIAAALRDGGLDATSHQLRHTAGTAALQATGDVTIAQALLGHRQLSTTQVYARPRGLTHDVLAAMYRTAPTTEGTPS